MFDGSFDVVLDVPCHAMPSLWSYINKLEWVRCRRAAVSPVYHNDGLGLTGLLDIGHGRNADGFCLNCVCWDLRPYLSKSMDCLLPTQVGYFDNGELILDTRKIACRCPGCVRSILFVLNGAWLQMSHAFCRSVSGIYGHGFYLTWSLYFLIGLLEW